MGGGHANVPLRSVERAMINADGTLGAFIVDPNEQLMSASDGHAAVVVGSSLYIIGGVNGTPTSRIERASLQANGLLGAFADSGVALEVPRFQPGAVVIGDYLYVIGGANGSGSPLDSVERAQINSDGTLGSFFSAGVSLKTASSAHTLSVIGNYVYVFGGYYGKSAYLGRIERAQIHGDGTLGAFDDANLPHLTTARGAHQSLILGSKLIVIGGDNGSPLTTIEEATINWNDYSVGLFGPDTGTLTSGRSEAGLVQIGNFIYVIGGNQPLGTIERASINGSGALGAFSGLSMRLPKPAGFQFAVVIGNTAYLLDSVLGAHAPISPDGILGSFVQDSSLQGGCPVVLGNYLYVLYVVNNVTFGQRAPIKDDGTLGQWSAVQVTGQISTGALRLLAIGNSVVRITGGNNSGPVAIVERATPAADGSLAFSTAGTSPLMVGRERGTVALLRNNVFVFSGFNDTPSWGGTTPPTEVSQLGTDFTLGPFKGAGGTVENYDESAVVIGGHLYEVSGKVTPWVRSCSVTDSSLTFLTAQSMPPTTQSALGFAATVATISNVYVLGGADLADNPVDSIEQAELE
jgi:hypothetical protein